MAQRVKRIVIDDLKAAEFFVDVASVNHLGPFLKTEVSLSEAAQQLKLSKSRMSYWLKKMLELDLIYTVRVERRGRHQIPIYSSRAEEFIVPADKIPVRPDQDVFVQDVIEQRIQLSLDYSRHKHSKDWQIKFTLVNAVPQLLFIPPGHDSENWGLSNYWGQVKLNSGQAKAFHQEIRQLFEKYLQSEDEAGKPHVFKLVLVEEHP